MIEKVEFRNFKALRDVSLELERLTVLVGPNASGKTSVLEGLYHLLVAESGPQEECWNSNHLQSITTRGAKEPPSFHLIGDRGNFHIKWSLRARTIQQKHDIQKSVFTMQGRTGTNGKFADYGPAVLLHLDMNRVLAPSYVTDAVPQMEADGSGLASVLAYMASNMPDDFAKLREALRSVVPSVQDIRTPRAKVVRVEPDSITVEGKRYDRLEEREYWGNSIEFDMDGAPQIPAGLASEGTLLVLGLLTAIMGPVHPRVVLLDDLERALHPKAQRDLVDLLRKLLDQDPNLQIVATSHSPYLLDNFRPEEVRLTARKDDGSVAIARLDEHPQFEKWKEEMSPGEFWSLVGEQWVAEAAAGGQQ